MKIEFSGDEMILAVISLVRAIDPKMLRQGTEGFEIDFQALDAKKELSADELLLLKFRVMMEHSGEQTQHSLELTSAEGSRLAEAIMRIETLGAWAPDVLQMSRRLRARLTASGPHGTADEHG